MSSQALLYVIVLPAAWLLLWPLKSARSRQALLLVTSYALYASWGISFWTFQALPYLFDVYRKEELDPSLLEFLLYMAF